MVPVALGGTAQPPTELAPGHSLLLSLNCHLGDGTRAVTSCASEAAGGQRCGAPFWPLSLEREGSQRSSRPVVTTDLVACLYFRV